MRKHIYRKLLILGIMFVHLFSSCEAEKEFIDNQENGKKMKRIISFEQFKKEVNKPHFKLEFKKSALSRDITDFEIDSTIVKSLETNKIVYTLKLNPINFNPEDKLYNLVVYSKDNEIVQNIVEYNPTQPLYDESDEAIKQFLESSTTSVIYSSRIEVQPFCTVTITQDRCNCAGHTVEECNGCNLGFSQQSFTYITYCGTGGGSNPPTDPNDPNYNPGGDNGGTTTDPVMPSYDQNTTIPCQELKKLSNSIVVKQSLVNLETKTLGVKEFGFAIKKSSTNPSGFDTPTTMAQNPKNPNSLNINPYLTGEYVGIEHNHINPQNGFPMFSGTDILNGLFDLANNAEVLNSNLATPLEMNYQEFFVTVAVADVNSIPSKNITFAVKIKDWNAFYGYVSTNNKALLAEKIDALYQKLLMDAKNINPDIIMVPIESLKKALLKEISSVNLGVGLYEASSNLNNWSEVIYTSDNLPLTKKPCN